jgi:hypothetical protein
MHLTEIGRGLDSTGSLLRQLGRARVNRVLTVFEVLTTVVMKSPIFWGKTPCIPLFQRTT